MMIDERVKRRRKNMIFFILFLFHRTNQSSSARLCGRRVSFIFLAFFSSPSALVINRNHHIEVGNHYTNFFLHPTIYEIPLEVNLLFSSHPTRSSTTKVWKMVLSIYLNKLAPFCASHSGIRGVVVVKNCQRFVLTHNFHHEELLFAFE